MRKTMMIGIAALALAGLSAPAQADEYKRIQAERSFARALDLGFDNACHRGATPAQAWLIARSGLGAERENLVKYHTKSAHAIEAEVFAELSPCEDWHLKN